ncbi:hypothetical protein ACIRJM_09420 [Streptomyces sp. NPDC102405]|uniref:hypothetical protein n=1 Tax=Streptomyces sp. NPDC102405 TaxID=3366170 RepID=UPI0037FA447D
MASEPHGRLDASQSDPQPHHERARDTEGPARIDEFDAWLIARDADAREVLRSPDSPPSKGVRGVRRRRPWAAPGTRAPTRRHHPPPDRDLAFGRGVRSCPGSQLAREQLNLTLQELTGRLPGLRLAEGQPVAMDPPLAPAPPLDLVDRVPPHGPAPRGYSRSGRRAPESREVAA